MVTLTWRLSGQQLWEAGTCLEVAYPRTRTTAHCWGAGPCRGRGRAAAGTRATAARWRWRARGPGPGWRLGRSRPWPPACSVPPRGAAPPSGAGGAGRWPRICCIPHPRGHCRQLKYGNYNNELV